MKYIVFFIVIFTTIPSVMAQTIEVEGHVRDSERNDLIGATVCCFTSDTLLVASMITDSKGDFRLKLSGGKQAFRLQIGYLGYKEMTLILNPTEEKLVRLGDITLSRSCRFI